MGKLSFRGKLILVFFVAAILEGCFIGFFSFSQSKKIVVENKKSEMADTINRIDININVKVRYITRIAESIVSSQIIKDALSDETNGFDKKDRQAYLKEYCDNTAGSVEALSRMTIIKNGTVFYESRPKAEGEIVLPEVLYNYTELASGNREEVQWLGVMDGICQVPGLEKKQVISVMQAILDKTGRQVIGVLLIELETETFSGLLLGNQGLFENQYTLVVDKKAEVICSNKNADFSWMPEADRIFEGGLRKFEMEWEGRMYFACGQYNGITGWKTYSVIPLDLIFGQAEVLKKSILFLAITCTLGAVTVVSILSYLLTIPIKKLSAAMDTVRKGNFKVQIPNKRQDEIGKLTNTFNFMVNEINTLITQVYQEKIAQKNAELMALQSQINPHFLYNTLDSINWMLINRGEDDISEVVISLGELMRYCIEGEGTFTTLEQEMQYVICYLKIQKNRLEERLKYQVSMEDRIGNTPVPRLILQPVVENAIRHGIEPNEKGGTVAICAASSGEGICIIIEDDGKGMSEQQIANLQKSKKEDGHTGIGLMNVQRRIRLHYGEEYGMRIESVSGHGTKITLLMPRHLGEESV